MTLRKGGDGKAGNLSFLKLDELPKDLGLAFNEHARTMPRARLGAGSWQFEEEPLAKLRDKIVAGRKTLGEVYGAPMRGIVTGFNKAFIVDTPTRDRLVAADPKSTDLLRPFLRGEDVKRWHVEPEGLWLINTPKGKVDIEAYPAIRDWLLPFRLELEKRATKQEWWELQQAQFAYQPKFELEKVVYPEFSQGPKFCIDRSASFLGNKCFFILAGPEVAAFLNSKSVWFWLFGETSPLRGGQWRLELREQDVSVVPIPDMPPNSRSRLAALGQICTEAARERFDVQSAARRRILDLAPPERAKLTGKLNDWHELDFTAFRKEVKRAFRADIPLRERGEWETYLRDNTVRVRELSDRIASAEREVDRIVYGLFDLTPDEISLLEASLEGQY